MKILTLNAGSSSIKYKLFDMDKNILMASGLIDRIGESSSNFKFVTSEDEIKKNLVIKNHQEALALLVEYLTDSSKGAIKDTKEIGAVSHRIVHGGVYFKEATIITPQVLQAIEDTIPLAPLHNPAHAAVIRLSLDIFKDIPQVTVFDTAFHQTIPDYAHIYAIPYSYYTDHKIRRYGFHGTSHQYVYKKAAEFLHVPAAATNMITIHIGNGASMAAIKNEKCIDTSMGLTPLEGLIMGTRSGDLDPAILHFLSKNCKKTPDEIDTMLNKESGMRGITGENDLRIIEENFLKGNDRARLALQMYAYRIKKYIGAYLAILGKLDAIVFTAGVGENSAIVREMSLKSLEHLGIILDETKNNQSKSEDPIEISREDSAVKILVVPTNEELEMSIQTLKLVGPR